MRNKILLLLIIIFSITSFNLIACSKNINLTNEEKQKKAEECVEKMYRGLIEKKLTYENIWDDYFSETTKNIDSSVLDRKEFIAENKTNDFKKSNVYTDVMVSSTQEVKDNIFEVKVSIKYKSNGKEVSEDKYFFVINENNQFKILYQGIMSVEKHADVTIDNIVYKNINIINYIQGIGIKMDVVNNSESAISLGYSGDSTDVLKTDKGEYSYKLPFSKIEKGQTIKVPLFFSNVDGSPQEVLINDIYYLDAIGLAKDKNDAKTHRVVIN